MAVKDTSRKPYIVDRDSNIKIGMDLPVRRGDDKDGMFATTKTTMEAVKNNIRNLLSTNQGERLMQPNLGIDLRSLIFEQVDSDTILSIQNKILDSLETWLPFVQVTDIEVVNDESRTDINQIVVRILFNLEQDPTSTDSVSLDFSSNINDSANSSAGGY
tara:strand:- start:36 stop:515 length:480 start_codon:yes stop_codon:yes gene_type:complete